MITLALRSALSDRASEDKVVVVDSWGFDAPRTKDAAAALAALGLEGRALVVLDRDDANAALSFRNLPEVQLIQAGELNAYDVLCNDWIVFTKAALRVAERRHEAPSPPAAERRDRDRERRRAAEAREPTTERGSRASERRRAVEPPRHEQASTSQRRRRAGVDERQRAAGDASELRASEETTVMKDPRDIILAPVVSEKSYALMETGVYTFKVHRRPASRRSATPSRRSGASRCSRSTR